jgi:hypothetical protein|tara:strand:- start:132 stop:347 length:216 start_codon:yes stop_codon:yes gene_type:complete
VKKKKKEEEEEEEERGTFSGRERRPKKRCENKFKKEKLSLHSLHFNHTQLTFVLLFPLPYSFYTRTRTTEY